MVLVAIVCCAVAAVVSSARWLRVAQREHYHPGRVTRFATRWWGTTRPNLLLALGAVTGSLAAFSRPVFGVVTAGVVAAGPLGLSLRGRTSKLVWTRRLRTLAVVVAALGLVLFVLTALAGDSGAALAAMLAFLTPVVIDLGLAITAPFERRAQHRWVRSAESKLRAVGPTTVAITGSFGKTSTKQYVRHLLTGERSVLASPASFNNTNGLARTLNEHLAPGTQVFVAEMGMYELGEIRAMCRWVRPDVGVIVNIGPVHLERVGSLDGIVAAKSEIAEHPSTIVLNVSAHGLAALADRLAQQGKRVVRVATEPTPGADVVVQRDGDDLVVEVAGAPARRVPGTTAQPANVAAALGTALALDVPAERLLPRLDTLPQPEHRQEVTVTPGGLTVIDNTFSSNPASAKASLELLDRHASPTARAVVVTPGMVELGSVQFLENAAFATATDDVATDLVIVGHTNRKALLAGAARRDLTVHMAANREVAVQWVRDNLGPGDVVLYENDLPDHFP